MVLPLSALPSAPPVVRAGLWGVDVALGDLHVGAAKLHAVGPRSASGPRIRDVIVRNGGVSLAAAEPIASAKAFVLSGPPRLVVDLYLRGDAGGDVRGTAADDAVATPVAPAPAGPDGVAGGAPASLPVHDGPRFGVDGDRYRTVLALPGMPSRPPAVHATLWAVDVEVPGLAATRSASHVPQAKSPGARAIRDVVMRPGGMTIRTERPVGSARAFVLAQPPRLVVDLHPAPSLTVALAGPGSDAAPAGAGRTPPPPTAQAKRDPADTSARSAVMVMAAKTGGPVAGSEPRGNAPAATRPTSEPTTAVAGPLPPSGRMEALARSAAVELAALAGAAKPARPAAEAAVPDVATAARADHAPAGEQTAGAILPAADDGEARPTEGAEGSPRTGREYPLDEFRGHPMIWPELGAPFYTHADTAAATEKFLAPRRARLEALRAGGSEPPRDAGAEKSPLPRARPVLAADAPAAAHLLEADIAYLEALGSGGDPFAAVALYRRAGRVAPRFPDRDRGRVMVGFAELAAGLVPEAEGDFLHLAHVTEDRAVAALALLGAGRAARAAGHDERAARLLRGAIALGSAASPGACHARGALGSILAESGRGMQALEIFAQMRERCPAEIVRSPRMLLTNAAALAAAGQPKAAEELLLAIPDVDGELFARRKFLEGELALATDAPDFARRAYELVRADAALPPMVRGEATLRLARVEAGLGRFREARDLLHELTEQTANATLVARARALEAELLAEQGHHAEALALLERTDAQGPAGLAAAEGARSRIFPAWFAALRASGDHAGMLTAFFRYRGDGVARHLPPAEVVHVADAALQVGVPDLGMRILAPVHAGLRGAARAEARRILAQAALAKGEPAQAEHLAAEAARAAKTPEIRAEAERLRADALLRLGRVEEAARLLGDVRDTGRLLALAAGQRGQGGEAATAIAALEDALAKTGPAAARRSPGAAPDEVAGEELERPREGEVGNLLALAAAADRAGEHALAAMALRTALRLAPDEAGAGARYRLAHVESASAGPAAAAATYADAAAKETDPLLARAAAASAAYYRVLEERGLQRVSEDRGPEPRAEAQRGESR